MSKVIIIIGLPGSGKTTFIHQFISNKSFKEYLDWGRELQISPKGEVLTNFNIDDRFEDLIQTLKNNKNVILDGSSFCDYRFLCEAEYYLNLNFPNIQIEKYYFENNPKDATANVLYRENIKGGHWTRSNGELIFYGDHCVEKGINNGRRMYELIVEGVEKLSKNYIIPSNYTTLKIQVQDEKFHQGWRALMRE